MKINLIMPIILFGLLVLSRMITDIPNFTATIALVMFTGYLIQNRLLSILIVLTSQVVSDLYLGIYSSMIFVYAAYISIVLLSPIIMNKINTKSVIFSSVISPSIFFIISNFGVWLTGSMYTFNLSGLITCYVAGIPFFDESLISTILFALTIFSIMKLIRKEPKEIIFQQK
jgi:hypothetical protein